MNAYIPEATRPELPAGVGGRGSTAADRLSRTRAFRFHAASIGAIDARGTDAADGAVRSAGYPLLFALTARENGRPAPPRKSRSKPTTPPADPVEAWLKEREDPA
jgi:hypothetical protein